MAYITTKKLVPGMVVARDVYTYNDQLLIPANTVLTDSIIARLEFYSIPRVNIADEAPAQQEPESYAAKVINSPGFKEFKKNFTKNVLTLQNSIQDVLDKDIPLNEDLLLNQTTSLMAPAATSIEVFDMVHNMRQYDDSTYAHCINVSLICRVMAKWLNLSPEDTDVLTICGLVHDIGKLNIPNEIIKKPNKLTDAEYDIMKTHTTRGYDILRVQAIDKRISQAALMHHERCDGSGYPNGVTGDKIDDFAKIVAIADVYEAMTASRVYRGPLCPFKVIAIFEKEGLQKYDPHYILTFLEHIVASYINNNVRLSDGRIGEVIMINQNHLSKPIVKVGNDYVDLSKESSLYIEDLV